MNAFKNNNLTRKNANNFRKRKRKRKRLSKNDI